MFIVVGEQQADLPVDERERGGTVDRGQKLCEPTTHGSGRAGGRASLAMYSALSTCTSTGRSNDEPSRSHQRPEAAVYGEP